MTAFSTADLPASINTTEKLAVWVCNLHNFLYPQLTAVEAPGQAVRVATGTPFEVNDGSTIGQRFIARQSIALDRNWQQGTGKLWTFAVDLGTASIPTGFKS